MANDVYRLHYIEVQGVKVEAAQAVAAVERAVASLMAISAWRATSAEPVGLINAVEAILKGEVPEVVNEWIEGGPVTHAEAHTY